MPRGNQELAKFLQSIDSALVDLFDDQNSTQRDGAQKLARELRTAWAIVGRGKDLAYAMSDRIRERKALDRLVDLCKSSDADVQLEAVSALDQCLIPANRDVVAQLALAPFGKLVYNKRIELVVGAVGILESLFKSSPATSARLIEHGGLDAVLFACRLKDVRVLRHCAGSLANCAMYGSPKTQRDMIARNTAEWLFPLAFSQNASIQYYACLAISVLASNKDISKAILPSGTLELVKPFVTSHDPVEFAKSDPSHCQGYSMDWLRRLLPLLESGCKEAQCLAAFHFAMEACIKKEQNRLQVFQEIGAIAPLQAVARTGTAICRRLAKRALLSMGHEVPKHLSLELLTWQQTDIELWLREIGLAEYWSAFERCAIDGELLATLCEVEMEEELKILNRLHRRKLQREIVRLRSAADYSLQDTEGISEWLVGLGHEMAQYRGDFVRCGVTFHLLPHLTDEELRDELRVKNAIHRKKLLLAIEENFGKGQADHPDGHPRVHDLDVFISYRRANGSQLASLLKVHLQLRGLKVFLDVDELGAGKFDEAILQNIAVARHFLLVLTPNALDRCLGDNFKQDWVHKELGEALQRGCNIVPIVEDGFEWPARDELPEDIRCVSSFNSVSWSHEYQEAAIEKIFTFLKLASAPAITTIKPPEALPLGGVSPRLPRHVSIPNATSPPLKSPTSPELETESERKFLMPAGQT